MSTPVTSSILFSVQGAVQEMLNLSQQEYVSRIDELNQALILAWEKDQRVKALKIAIQVNITSQVLLSVKLFVRPPDQSVQSKTNFLITQVQHMLLGHKRTVSMIGFI